MKKGHAKSHARVVRARLAQASTEDQVLVAVTKAGSGGDPADSVITS